MNRSGSGVCVRYIATANSGSPDPCVQCSFMDICPAHKPACMCMKWMCRQAHSQCIAQDKWDSLCTFPPMPFQSHDLNMAAIGSESS